MHDVVFMCIPDYLVVFTSISPLYLHPCPLCIFALVPLRVYVHYAFGSCVHIHTVFPTSIQAPRSLGASGAGIEPFGAYSRSHLQVI